MLVLQVKADEVIQIGAQVALVPAPCRRGHVKIGIDAPKHVEITRRPLDEWRREQAKSGAAGRGGEAGEAVGGTEAAPPVVVDSPLPLDAPLCGEAMVESSWNN
jgi:carbon storage regulator CsrA